MRAVKTDTLRSPSDPKDELPPERALLNHAVQPRLHQSSHFRFVARRHLIRRAYSNVVERLLQGFRKYFEVFVRYPRQRQPNTAGQLRDLVVSRPNRRTSHALACRFRSSTWDQAIRRASSRAWVSLQ